MPLIVAILIEVGIARSSAARTPVAASARKRIPSTKTAARATRQSTPSPATTPKVK